VGARRGVVADDLLLRRVRWDCCSRRASSAHGSHSRRRATELGWDDARWGEAAAYADLWRRCYSLPIVGRGMPRLYT
jgi:hypothetical protein